MSDFIDDYLNKASPSDLRNVVRAQAISVSELQRRTLNVTTLDQITPRVGTRLDTLGHIGVVRLNRLLLFNTQATPSISVPPDALTGSNIFEVVLTGQFYQNTGVSQNITPRFYIGKAGSETLVSSEIGLSVAPGATPKAFEYRIRVTAAPSGGTKVQVDEKFDLENATAGTMSTIMRTTRTTVIDITQLSEIDSCFIRIANGATATMFRVYSNTVSVQILDAVQADEIHWYSQPGSSDGLDTYIAQNGPTTNWGTNAALFIGEYNAGTDKARTLINFSDVSNFSSDPDLIGLQLSEAYLYLTTSVEYSSNARTFRLYRLLVDFDQLTATWNIRKTATNWGAAGGLAGTDYDATALATCSMGASDAAGIVKAFTFTTYGLAELQKILNGTYTNYGFILIADTELDDMYSFHSSNSTLELAPMLYLIGSKPN